MKRIILTFSLMLAVVMAKSATEINGIYYTLYNNTKSARVESNPNKYRGVISIPSTVKFNGVSYIVNSIYQYAFSSCNDLTSITIPESITSIGKDAFFNCKNLTEVTFNTNYLSSLNSSSSNSLKAIFGSQVKKIKLGNSITKIWDYAFELCNRLTDVTIPSSVTSIGKYAFSTCNSLTSINIPDNVTSIECYAFQYCTGLTSITIPNKVTTIDINVFQNCTSLTSINIPNNITSIGGYAFQNCTGLTSITIPSSVTSIGSSAFKGCTSLTTITIPNSVKVIGYDVFRECSSLARVNISDISAWCGINFDNQYSNPLTYAHNLFLNGQKISNLVIPNSVTSIGGYAFYGCDNLTSLTIPESVASIGNGAFLNCNNLIEVLYNSKYLSSAYGSQQVSLINIFGTQVNKFILGNNISRIWSYAFEGFINMTSITIPNSVTSIGSYAFRNCTGLTSIIIPSSVTSISLGVLSGCTNISSIKVDAGNSVYDSRDNCDAIINTSTNSLISGCKNSIIPNSVTSIGSEAFYGCTGLTSITIPDGVTYIGDWAFCGCSGLTSITIPATVSTIKNGAFNDCRTKVYIMRKNGYYDTSSQCFTTNHVYGFSYLSYRLGNTGLYGSYFHPYDMPVLKVSPFDVRIESIKLENYDDEILSFRILKVDNKSYISDGLEPNKEHEMIYVMKTRKDPEIRGYIRFRTPDFKLVTCEPKVINSGEVILAADINLLDGASNAGFEWRKVDAPDVVPSKRGEAVVYGGRMEGIVKNLDVSSYYMVRPYYNAESGEEYFGEWVGFDPSDFSYFEPTVHTYDYVQVVDGVATLVGYAMQGSDDIISQGFEYWKESNAQANGFFSPSNGVQTLTTTGQLMMTQVNGLVGGTTYCYRTFVKTKKGMTYGEECKFTMPKYVGLDKGDMDGDGEINVNDVQSIINLILGAKEMTQQDVTHGDMDGDGELSVSDVMILVNTILGKQ